MKKINWAAKSQNRLLFAESCHETSSFSRKECPLEYIDSNTLVINLGMEMSWALLSVLMDLALINESIQLQLVKSYHMHLKQNTMLSLFPPFVVASRFKMKFV